MTQKSIHVEVPGIGPMRLWLLGPHTLYLSAARAADRPMIWSCFLRQEGESTWDLGDPEWLIVRHDAEVTNPDRLDPIRDALVTFVRNWTTGEAAREVMLMRPRHLLAQLEALETIALDIYDAFDLAPEVIAAVRRHRTALVETYPELQERGRP